MSFPGGDFLPPSFFSVVGRNGVSLLHCRKARAERVSAQHLNACRYREKEKRNLRHAIAALRKYLPAKDTWLKLPIFLAWWGM